MCVIHVAEHSVDDIDEIVFEAFVLLVFLVERQVAFALFLMMRSTMAIMASATACWSRLPTTRVWCHYDSLLEELN